jgi:hypothetical protein
MYPSLSACMREVAVAGCLSILSSQQAAHPKMPVFSQWLSALVLKLSTRSIPPQ